MTEIVKRTLSGFVFVCVIILTTIFSPLLFSLLMLLFLILSTLEFSKLQAISKWIVLPIAVCFYLCFPAIGFQGYKFYEIGVGVSLLTFSYLLYSLFVSRRFKFSSFSNIFLYVGYILIPFLLMIKIQSDRFELMLSAFLLIWFNDTFAYLSGINFGKHKLFPSVSPKKTIEGFVGGMLMTILASLGIHFLIFTKVGFTLVNWVIFAVLISVFSTFGDLVQSKLKRTAGVKDSGNFMPGHGGVLDRLDSVIFVTPILFLLIKITEYVS